MLFGVVSVKIVLLRAESRGLDRVFGVPLRAKNRALDRALWRPPPCKNRGLDRVSRCSPPCKNGALNRAVLVLPSVQKSCSRSCFLAFSSVQKPCTMGQTQGMCMCLAGWNETVLRSHTAVVSPRAPLHHLANGQKSAMLSARSGMKTFIQVLIAGWSDNKLERCPGL